MDDTTFATGPDTFRAAMRHHAKGVAVITAGAENPVGFCATSLSSVSLEPPVVSFTVGLRSASWRTVESARHVMVHLLADHQADLASRFGRTDAGQVRSCRRAGIVTRSACPCSMMSWPGCCSR